MGWWDRWWGEAKAERITPVSNLDEEGGTGRGGAFGEHSNAGVFLNLQLRHRVLRLCTICLSMHCCRSWRSKSDAGGCRFRRKLGGCRVSKQQGCARRHGVDDP